MDQLLGPFAVTPTQIANLGAAFTPFVNALLRAEIAASGLSGSMITTTYQENIGDEGVDAGLRRAVETRFIPAGDSTWQFKRGDLTPAKCRTELAGATAALDILRAGGKYRLVDGADINYPKVSRRREALREEAARLGIELEDDSIEVLTASDLAEWAERHPSLAISQLLGSIRGSVEDFYAWAGSSGAVTKWVESSARQTVADTIHQLIETSNKQDLHIEGVSGLGKSRIALEALRGQPYESLVIYVRDAATFPASIIQYLTGEGRIAILVIDECDPRQHKNLAAALPASSGLKLITIGEPGPSRSGTSSLALPPIEDTAMAEILRLNRPNLWPEASYFVTEMAAGNVRLALVLAEAVEREPRSSAARLITQDVIRTYVTEALPDGTSFLACCALSLFTIIGYNGESATELQRLSEAVGLNMTELRAAARTLAELGLLTSKGRFRSVAPQPLAVYLASRGWGEFETEIIEHLANLDPGLTERLLQRAAEVGPSSAVLRAADAILARPELFGSLSALVDSGYTHALTQLAILAPGKVSDKLTEILGGADDDELRAATAVRRDLVWTLEKLAWHSDTFEPAADALLRLAVNETESYGNNASGVWCSLFGVMLPSTAASPNIRMAYITRVSASTDVRARRLVAKAAAAMLVLHETVMSSAERQRGVVVEPRGRPATFGEIWEYHRAAIRLLLQLVDDQDEGIAEVAVSALVSAIHPFLEYEAVRGDLFAALKSLPSDGLRRVRTETTHLQGLFQRVSGVEARRAGLDLLIAELPEPSGSGELRALVYTRRWDLGEGELQSRITDAARPIIAEHGSQPLLALFADELPAAFELGRALAELAAGDATLASLAALATGRNSPALVGYLWGLIAAGDNSAFDNFLDSEAGLRFDPAMRLGITVGGPRSEPGWHRVGQLNEELPVATAAAGLFGWHIDIETPQLIALITSWLSRIESQRDYNAAVDFVAMAVFQRPPWIDDLDELVIQLVEMRNRFPETGQQSWNWAQLAKRRIERQPFELLKTLLSLIDAGALQIFVPGEERELLAGALRSSDEQGWDLVVSMLEGGAWRVQMDVRGWLTDQFPLEVVTGWIGSDVERAKLAASVADVGSGDPNPVARYLLEHFDRESQVAFSLANTFISGSWTGKESDRLATQIAQLQRWAESPSEPGGVKRWAREIIKSLERQRKDALQREAEQDFS